jgi:hypothetical protein
MDRVVLVARLKPDVLDRAGELVAQEDTADIDGFDRKAIFISPSEVVFFFEGREVDKSVRAILDDPVRSTPLDSWLPLFDGPLHRAPEVYFWERQGARPF